MTLSPTVLRIAVGRPILTNNGKKGGVRLSFSAQAVAYLAAHAPSGTAFRVYTWWFFS